MSEQRGTGGAGETRLPPTAPPSPPPERLARVRARLPFSAKLTIVWLGIFIVLGGFFAAAAFDTDWMLGKFRYVSGGLRYTMTIAVAGIALAIAMALIGALGRLSRNALAFGLSGFYTSFFRGTPLIVQMFLIYLALPQVGVNLEASFPGLPSSLSDVLTLDAAVAGVLALGLNYGAYMTEIFRAGIQAVGHGQGEAAEALGMTYRQKMRRIVLPQAFRIIIPPTGNEFIAMMKDSALVSFLGASATTAELFRRAQLMGKKDFKSLEALLLAAGLYWALTAIFTYFQGRLERRLSKGHVRTVEALPH